MNKQTALKRLPLNSETIRSLTRVSEIGLANVRGGEPKSIPPPCGPPTGVKTCTQTNEC
jgi:hypothetical protein